MGRIITDNSTKKQILSEDQMKIKDVNDSFFSAGLEARRPFEIIWYRNMAFFLGYQYVEWDNYKGTLKVPTAPSWRVRAVVNHLQPNTMHTVSRLNKNAAIFTTVPYDATNDMATNASQVAKRILLYVQQRNQARLVHQDVCMMAYIYGSGYKQLFWDPLAGDPIVYAVDNKGRKTKRLYTGDIGLRPLSPFQVVWEVGATDINGCSRLGIMFTMTLDEIRERFKWGEYVKAEVVKNTSSMESTLINLLNRKFLSDSSRGIQESKEDEMGGKGKGFATIKAYLELPCDKYPRGRTIYTANGVLLEEESDLPNEYMIKCKSFGIQKYDYIKLHDRWHGETPFNQQVPIQVKINRTHSSIQEIENEMAKPKWLVHKLSQVARTAIDNEPGEIIKHNTPVGYPEPHPIQGVEIPATLFSSVEVDIRNMELASNIHETSKGGQAPGIESKVAMQFLEEQDQTIYAPVLTRFEIKEEELWTWALELAREKYKEDRKLEIVGPDNEMETYDFEATDKFSTRVKVIPGSSFPTSLAAKQQTILNFFMSGAFGDQQSIPESLRLRIMTSAQVGDVDEIYRELRIDIKESQREHKLWEKGIVLPPNQWDNHSIMAREHNNFRKTNTFRILAETMPEVAEMINKHIEIHETNTPEYLASVAQQRELEEQKQIALADKAIERRQKQEEIQGKQAERILALSNAAAGVTNKAQTVKE